MKTSARFLAMLLAVVMIAGAALSASAFDDIAGNDHANAISVLNQLGVIGGYEDGTFKPDQKVTRAEMAKLAYVLYTTFVDAGAGTTAFSDVAADNWAAGYIRWCSQMGIIGGYGDGKFGPTDNVTYDQALKMVCGVLGYNEWDSNLWPTDVRSKALRDLELGEGLDGVNGNDQLTRAQVAQIMYNALNKPMKETKTINVQVPIAGGGFITMPQEVAKTLAVDIWKFTEVPYTVVATENYSVTGSSKTGNKDKVTLAVKEVSATGVVSYTGAKTYELKELGLESFSGNTDNLVGLEVVTLIDHKGEMLSSAAVKGSVVDGVEVKYNKDKDVLTVAGVDYDAEDVINIWALGEGIVETAIFDSNEEIITAVIDILDKAYFARAIDVDGDAKVDGLAMSVKTAYKVDSVGTGTSAKVKFTELDGAGSVEVLVANVNITVAKDDIVVAAQMAGKVYAEKIEAVETYATKISGSKATLATGDVVSFANITVAGVPAVALTTANLGETAKTGYYFYNGELLLCEDVKVVVTNYDFAVLKEIVKNEGKVDTETMTSGDTYEAVIIVNGEEKKVALKSTEAVIIGDTSYTAAEAYDLYKVATVEDTTVTPNVDRLSYNYALISTYAEKDGVYTLTIGKKLADDDILATSGTISYDAKIELYTVADTKRVVLDENSVIFYPYTKETTGNFKWLGNYTASTITKKNFEVTLNAAYLAKNTNGTYTLLAAYVTEEIEGSSDVTTVDYRTKGSLITYAYADASAVVEDGKIYYEYSFLDNATLENKAAAVDTTKTVADGAVATEAGKFYAWDATNEEYLEVTSTTNTFNKAVLTKMIEYNNILDYTVGGTKKEVKVTDDIKIWGLGVDEDGKEVLDAYVTLTAAELREMIALANGDESTTDDDKTVNAIIVSDKNEEGEFDIVTIIVEIFETNKDDEVVSINNALFR